MADKDGIITTTGTVKEVLPNAVFRVMLPNGYVILCTISGKLRMNNIRILVDDHVRVEMSPYDLNRGRIVWRDKPIAKRKPVPNSPESVSTSSETSELGGDLYES